MARDGNFKMVLLFFLFFFKMPACHLLIKAWKNNNQKKKHLFDEDVNMFDANRHDTRNDETGSMDFVFVFSFSIIAHIVTDHELHTAYNV